MWKDFKAFAMRGNVVDLAVGVIIGAAFGKIVTSVVNDLLMPPLGLVLGKVDFKSLYVPLDGRHFASIEDARKAAAPILAYGSFLQAVMDFIIMAFVIFVLVRQINRLAPPQGAPPAAATRECPQCLSVIPVKATRCAHCAQPV